MAVFLALAMAASLLPTAAFAANDVCKIDGTSYETLAKAVAAATEGQTVEIVVAGEYTIPTLSKNITIKGAVAGVVFNCVGSDSIASIPNGATFEGVTMNFGNNSYHGFQYAGDITMKNCTLNGLFFSYGNMMFEKCTFKQTSNEYCMWVYDGDTITYDTCTFNTCGKVLTLNNENNGPHNLVVKDCTFKNESNPVKKPAILIKSKFGTDDLEYDVTISGVNTLVGNWPSESSVYKDGVMKTNGLWDVEDDGSKITVTVDGVKKYPASENSDPIKNDVVNLQVKENAEKGNLYFNKALTDYNVSCKDSDNMPVDISVNGACVTLPGLPSNKLATNRTVTVSSGNDSYNVTASPLSYCYAAQSDSDSKVSDVAKAVYQYYLNADAYFETHPKVE